MDISKNLTFRAGLFAKMKHLGQLDDEGKDYFESHIKQVYTILLQITEDVEILAAAYLHDTIEDTDTSYEEILNIFGKRVADLVMEVTHEGEKDSKGYFFPRLKSKDAILIKFADRLSNLSRMQSWDLNRQNHYLKKSKFWKSE
jgi:(p)ppGpp synthase/HD superfamily hydrolase